MIPQKTGVMISRTKKSQMQKSQTQKYQKKNLEQRYLKMPKISKFYST
jgi:hypothetical protein